VKRSRIPPRKTSRWLPLPPEVRTRKGGLQFDIDEDALDEAQSLMGGRLRLKPVTLVEEQQEQETETELPWSA
jgi:hypothetical protein